MSLGIKKELVVVSIIFVSLVGVWNLYDYRASVFGGTDALAASSSHVASLSVTVAQSITLTQNIGSTVAFGTLTPGTKVTGKTGLAILTNGTGINITAGRQRAITNVTLASNAAPTLAVNQISDTSGGIDVFNGIANCSTPTSHPAVWAAGVSTGLGFSNYGFSGGSAKSTACFGTGSTVADALNQYTALQASNAASSFISSSGYSATSQVVSVGYALDVTGTQKATTYAGGIVYSATSNP